MRQLIIGLTASGKTTIALALAKVQTGKTLFISFEHDSIMLNDRRDTYDVCNPNPEDSLVDLIKKEYMDYDNLIIDEGQYDDIDEIMGLDFKNIIIALQRYNQHVTKTSDLTLGIFAYNPNTPTQDYK